MTGIDVPIGGDLAPFHAAIAELSSTMAKLGKDLNRNLRPARTETAQATRGFRTMGRTAGIAFRGMRTSIRMVYQSLVGLGRRLRSLIPGGGLLGPIAGIAAAVGGIALVTRQLRGAFSAAAGFEDLEVRISSFLGSTERAKNLLADLQNFADKTPFATTDIQEAAGSLLASGIRGDISQIIQQIAAVSRDGQQLRELSEAVGKGFARGRFQTRELNAFLQRGINLMPVLARVTGLTGDALQEAIRSGLGFEQVTQAISLLSQEGGEFYGLLERRSRTAAGLISTLGSVWDTVRREFAQPVLDALKPALMQAITFVEGLKNRAAALGRQLGQGILAAFAVIRSGQLGTLLATSFKLASTTAVDVLFRGVRSIVAFLGTTIPPIFQAAFAKFQDPQFWAGVGLFLEGAAAGFAAQLRSALGQNQFARSLELQAETQQALAAIMMQRAGNGLGALDILTRALADGTAAARDAFGAPGQDVLGARDAMRDLLASVRDQTRALAASAAVPEPATGATGAGLAIEDMGESIGASVARAVQSATLTTSLGRIGGADFGITFGPVVSEQKRTNNILTAIRDKLNTSPQPLPVI